MTSNPPESASRAAKVWTTGELLAWLTSAFIRAELDSPRLLAETLVSHVTGLDRLSLYTTPERPASSAERATLRELTARALAHEPVQYLAGEAWFYALSFAVDRRVLIPRPSTETLVDQALEHLKGAAATEPAPRVADIGVGSGAIAISVLVNAPAATAVASDVSPEALEVARANASRLGVTDRLELREGSLLEPLAGAGAFTCVLSNPPYIPDHEWDAVPPNVRNFEPEGALRGGVDGLRFARAIIEGAPALLAPGGLLAVEIAASAAPEALAAAQEVEALVAARVEKDLEGHPRVLVARRRD